MSLDPGDFFYPPKRDHPLGDPLGVPFEYLLVLYSDKFFLLRKKVLSPVAGATEMLPYGVPFDLSFFFIFSPISFF